MKKNLKTIILGLSCLLLFVVTVYYFTMVRELNALRGKYPVFNAQLNKYELVEDKPSSWIDIKSFPNVAKWAIVVSEDWAFYEHEGIDKNQIKKALESSLEEGHLTRGASTITQQVVKNLILTPEKTITRKIKEILLALELEKRFTKEEILEFYINLIELGDGVYGVEQASQKYFQKSAKTINGKEGAFLAMLLPSPIKYSQSFEKEGLTTFANEQVNNILIKLRQAKIINESERSKLSDYPLSFEVMNFIDEDDIDVLKESYKTSEDLDLDLINTP